MLKEKLKDELYDYEEKIKKNPNARMSDSEVQKVHMLSDTVKNLCKIEMLEGGEYSEDDGMMYAGDRRGGNRTGGDYSRDGEWTARGNYNTPHHNMGGGHAYNEGGSSYGRRKRDSMGRYSREDGKENMTRQLRDMMEDAEGEEREVIRECVTKLERM